jgi:Predicted transcriptional regulators
LGRTFGLDIVRSRYGILDLGDRDTTDHDLETEQGMKNNIRVQRAVLNITQEELANALNVTRQTIIAIENGKYDPSLTLAFRMSKFFKKSIEELFETDE